MNGHMKSFIGISARTPTLTSFSSAFTLRAAGPYSLEGDKVN